MPRFKHVIKVKRKKGSFRKTWIANTAINHYELYKDRVYMILMNGRRKLSTAITVEEIQKGIKEGTWEIIKD